MLNAKQQTVNKLAAFLALAGFAMQIQAQGAFEGTVQFFNSVLSPIYYQETPGSPQVLAPIGTHVGIFWGTVAEGQSSVVGMGRGTLDFPTATIQTPGLWNGDWAYLGSEGQFVWLKIGAWIGGTGTSLENATAYGESAVVGVTLGPRMGPPTVVWQGPNGTATDRAKSFAIVPIPEPSVIALSAFFFGVLLLRRKL
jgi:hypothetical protein